MFYFDIQVFVVCYCIAEFELILSFRTNLESKQCGGKFAIEIENCDKSPNTLVKYWICLVHDEWTVTRHVYGLSANGIQKSLNLWSVVPEMKLQAKLINQIFQKATTIVTEQF